MDNFSRIIFFVKVRLIFTWKFSDYLTEFHKSQNEVYFIYVVHTAAITETQNGKLNIRTEWVIQYNLYFFKRYLWIYRYIWSMFDQKVSVIDQNWSSVSHSVVRTWSRLQQAACLRFNLFLVVQKVGFKNNENLIFINFLVFRWFLRD